MVSCPKCDSSIDVEEEELDEGDVLSCDECGASLTVASVNPVELASEDDDEDEEEDFDYDEDEEFHFWGQSGDVNYQLRATAGGLSSKSKTVSIFNSRSKVTLNLKLTQKFKP